MPEPYPLGSRERRRWIEERRGPRNRLDPSRPYGVFCEQEPGPEGVVDGGVVLVTNRECPWRCVMCDLWRNTLVEAGPAGAIAQQVALALDELGPGRGTQIKLYNAGSFFDPKAIPEAERVTIAGLLDGLDRVIVECHPRLVGDAVWRFRDALPAGVRLEVAMGLETADPVALERLEKGMTVETFEDAARALRASDVDARAFVLVAPPFQTEVARWALASVEVAAEVGCGLVALLPTRGGNGAMEALAAAGHYTPPSLALLEDVFDRALGRGVRVVVDLWDIDAIAAGADELERRKERLDAMNLEQRVLPRVTA